MRSWSARCSPCPAAPISPAWGASRARTSATPLTVLVVILFNLIMLALLEIPALGYVLAPETTPARVDRFKAALSAHGHHAGIWIAGGVGALLVLRGTIELLGGLSVN